MTRRAGLLALVPAIAGCAVVPVGQFSPAPIVIGEADSRPAQAASSASRLPQPDFDVPEGGPDTVGLAVAGCLEGCTSISVLLDPDNSWQRTGPEGTITGQSRKGLHTAVVDALRANGLHLITDRLDILPGNSPVCPEYTEGGQVIQFALAEAGSLRQIVFDTGCAGSASATAARDAVNALVVISELMDILAGPNRPPAAAQ